MASTIPPLSASIPPPPVSIMRSNRCCSSNLFLNVKLTANQTPGGVVCEDPAHPTSASLAHIARDHYREWQKSADGLQFVSFYRPVPPIIQRGPLCGMVALAMAANMLGKNVTSETILEKAISCSFTLQGEMFSSENLRSLAQDLLQCPASVIDISNTKHCIVDLLSNSILLVPYDADKNHQPCKRQGHKAHWAAIAGFCLVVDNENEKLSTQPQSCIGHDNKHLSTSADITGRFPNQEWKKAAVDIYVYARHGKSRQVGVWRWNDLVDSCQQLEQLEPVREADPRGYVVPPGGLASGLAGKVVRLAIPAGQ